VCDIDHPRDPDLCENPLRLQLSTPQREDTLPEKTHIAFPHRRNSDGTIDSICRGCFVTIATEATDAELEGAERKHICQGFDAVWMNHRTDQERLPTRARNSRLVFRES